MMRLSIRDARVHVEMDFFLGGSVLKGTVRGGCLEVRTHFELESDEPEDKLLLLIQNAKGGCFAEHMVRTAVPLKSVVRLNGKEIAVPLDP
ncbi:MAG: hypothetical protein ACE5IM_04040 [Nitrospinota bacterium]